MKNLRIILALTAFFFAMIPIFAVDLNTSLVNEWAYGYNLSGNCDLGILEQLASNCAVTAPTIYGRCTVKIGLSSNLTAFKYGYGECSGELWKQSAAF